MAHHDDPPPTRIAAPLLAAGAATWALASLAGAAPAPLMAGAALLAGSALLLRGRLPVPEAARLVRVAAGTGMVHPAIRAATGAQPAAEERRAWTRRPMGCGARLELAQRALAVNLFDLSEGGAGVEAPAGSAAPGDEGRLVLDTAVLPVRVVTAGDGRLGLAFTAISPLAAATIRSILADPGRAPDA